MDKRRAVKLSNVVGGIAILLLIYWVFTFILIEVFDFKVFRRNMTETFFMSVMGILAVMFGALMINIMLNLTLIADKQVEANDKVIQSRKTKYYGIILLLVFPLIFGFAYTGDMLTKRKKKEVMVSQLENLIKQDTKKFNYIANYTYSKEYLKKLDYYLNYFNKKKRRFDVIVSDSVDGEESYLKFYRYNIQEFDKIETLNNDEKHYDTSLYDKGRYVFFPSAEGELNYLKSIFNNGKADVMFNADRGDYTLYYPYKYKGNTIVIRYYNYYEYGKIGS